MSGPGGPDRYGAWPGEREPEEQQRSAGDHPRGAGALLLPQLLVLACGRKPLA